MEKSYTQLYRAMQAEISRSMQQPIPEKERIEKCFWIARDYGKKLKELIKNNDFADENEEISFFRNIKPQFVCYIEYFLMVCEALSIVPVKREAAIAFWKVEKERFRSFRGNYESFFIYYESGQHESDKTYFLRENNDLRFMPNLHIFDTDIDWCTSHDRLLRNYLAYKEYEEYCDKKLLELESISGRAFTG